MSEPKNGARSRRRVCVWLLAVLISFGWAHTSLLAQETEEPPTGLTDLSLEELMATDVVPINVLGTHTHLAGEWMIGYKFMFMRMDGNRDGPDRRTASEVLQDFPVTPTDMNMAMHMIEVMYAPSNDLTLMAMFPFLQLSMDHLTRTGVQFTTESQGIGDVSLSALYTVYGDIETGHRLVVIPGLSCPTGSIGEKDRTPAGPDQQLPYPMQLGSGTFGLLPGFAYLGESENWSWLARATGTIQLGKNSNDYSLGDRLLLTSRISRKLTNTSSLSARIAGLIWGNIDGADPQLNPVIVPTADPNRRGGERIDILFGVNVYVPKGSLKGNRLALEVGFPLYQALNGPQLETDWRVTAGWSWPF